MKLYIPTPGDRLKLTSDWTFTLYNDHHNWYFIDAIGLPHVQMQQCTLPAGARLKIGYWYVEGTRAHWDHVAFHLIRKKVDFRVGLSDIKLIDCEIHRPRRKPVCLPGDVAVEHCENFWDETDFLENWEWDENEDWHGDEDDSDISDEEWDELEDGWDDSFQPTLTY